jgi:hypothetical protein
MKSPHWLRRVGVSGSSIFSRFCMLRASACSEAQGAQGCTYTHQCLTSRVVYLSNPTLHAAAVCSQHTGLRVLHADPSILRFH